MKDYNKALELREDHLQALSRRGNLKGKLQDQEGAISDLTKSIDIFEKDLFYLQRGVFKSELNDYTGAIADYSKAIQINPKNALAYNKRVHAKDKLEKYD